jgi:hypothetical protein
MSGHVFAARSDSLQLLCFSVFLYFIFKYFFFQTQWLWLAGAMFFALAAIFTKQDSTIHIFIILIAFCAWLRSKRAVLVLTGFSLIICTAFGLAWLLLGRFLVINTIIYNFQVLTEIKNTYNIRIIIISLIRLFPLVLTVFYLIYRKGGSQDKRTGIFIAAVALCYIIITHLMMFRAAASINYSYPAALLLVIGFAVLCDGESEPTTGIGKLAYILAAAYLAMLALADYKMGIFRFNQSEENMNKQEYTALLTDRYALEDAVKNDTVFFINPKYTPVFEAAPLIYGYEKHIDRVIEILSGQQVHSKMMFVPTTGYDSCFTNGNVKYIIADNNAESRKQMGEYYGSFVFSQNIGDLCLYQYNYNSGAVN